MWILPSGVSSTFPGGSASGQSASANRSPYQLGSMGLSGLVGNGMVPAVQSSANQRRIMAAVDALHPFSTQFSIGPVLGPAIRACAQRLSYCGNKGTGGSREILSPHAVGTAWG